MFEPLHLLLTRGNFLVRNSSARLRTYYVYRDVENLVSGYKHTGLVAITDQVHHESVLEFTTPNSITLTQKCEGRYLKPSRREYV